MSRRTLLVSLHGMEVGHLWADGTHSSFTFHEAYLDAADRPVLGQHFEDRLRKVTRRRRGMHPWFENALPEKAGLLRERVARAHRIDPEDSAALLALLGDDLPGAVRIREVDAGKTDAAIIDETGQYPYVQARFSLGGVQLKFSMSGEPGRLRLGVGDPEDREWILKIGPEAFPGLAENEHAIMSWCRTAGFDVPETCVVPVRALPHLGSIPSTPTAFLVRRYDRTPEGRVHQEDFAQVLGVRPEAKYEATDAAGLSRLARQILGEPGAEEYLRRLVVIVATGNADAHLKNWSLIYRERTRAAWSPLYDQVATIAYPQLGARLALRIGHAQHLHQVERHHLRWVGSQAGIRRKRCDELVDGTLEALRDAFPRVDIPDALASRLTEHWSRVPLLREFTLRR